MFVFHQNYTVILVTAIQNVDWFTVEYLIYITKHFYLRGTPIIRAGIAVKDACKNLFFFDVVEKCVGIEDCGLFER